MVQKLCSVKDRQIDRQADRWTGRQTFLKVAIMSLTCLLVLVEGNIFHFDIYNTLYNITNRKHQYNDLIPNVNVNGFLCTMLNVKMIHRWSDHFTLLTPEQMSQLLFTSDMHHLIDLDLLN